MGEGLRKGRAVMGDEKRAGRWDRRLQEELDRLTDARTLAQSKVRTPEGQLREELKDRLDRIERRLETIDSHTLMGDTARQIKEMYELISFIMPYGLGALVLYILADMFGNPFRLLAAAAVLCFIGFLFVRRVWPRLLYVCKLWSEKGNLGGLFETILPSNWMDRARGTEGTHANNHSDGVGAGS
jgi:hypothetical protein